jgi:hypothetical protein
MQMKLFHATGSSDEIKKLEDDVGRWLQALPSDVEVKHVCSAITAAPSVANKQAGSVARDHRMVGQARWSQSRQLKRGSVP